MSDHFTIEHLRKVRDIMLGKFVGKETPTGWTMFLSRGLYDLAVKEKVNMNSLIFAPPPKDFYITDTKETITMQQYLASIR